MKPASVEVTGEAELSVRITAKVVRGSKGRGMDPDEPDEIEDVKLFVVVDGHEIAIPVPKDDEWIHEWLAEEAA